MYFVEKNRLDLLSRHRGVKRMDEMLFNLKDKSVVAVAEELAIVKMEFDCRFERTADSSSESTPVKFSLGDIFKGLDDVDYCMQ